MYSWLRSGTDDDRLAVRSGGGNCKLPVDCRKLPAERRSTSSSMLLRGELKSTRIVHDRAPDLGSTATASKDSRLTMCSLTPWKEDDRGRRPNVGNGTEAPPLSKPSPPPSLLSLCAWFALPTLTLAAVRGCGVGRGAATGCTASEAAAPA